MPSPFSLCDLPSEILLAIGLHLPFRLGLPTGALNRHLAELFRTPTGIATRALLHYPNPSEALLDEVTRSESGASEVVAALCARTANLSGILNEPEPKDWRRQTPLSAAAEGGNVDVVKILISAGADVRAAGDQALRYASSAGHVEIVRLLLDNGGVAGGRMLCDSVSSRFCSLDVLRLLLDRVATIHRDTELALIGAAGQGHCEAVRFLLARGAHVNARNSAALYTAAQARQFECVLVLLDRGANVNCRNGFVLWEAVRSGEVDIVCMLLERGADTHLGDRFGALAEAKRRGHKKVVKLIEEHGQ
ncbi:hypothetical protein HDU93_001047 [Gonapodya sp. JEL0774]|nr:hypothetical protein HDU93_001047 [Gonapodya sp. JEL0774]